jgi:hypothetical protein
MPKFQVYSHSMLHNMNFEIEIPQTPLTLKRASMSLDTPQSIMTPVKTMKQEFFQSSDICAPHFDCWFEGSLGSEQWTNPFFSSSLFSEHHAPDTSSHANQFGMYIVAVNVFCKVASQVKIIEMRSLTNGANCRQGQKDFKNSILYSFHSAPHSSDKITGRLFANGTLSVNSLKTFDVQPIVEWVDSQLSIQCESFESAIFSKRSHACIFNISAIVCISLPFRVEYKELLTLFESKPSLGKFQCTSVRPPLLCGQGPMISFASPAFGKLLTATIFHTGKCQIRLSGDNHFASLRTFLRTATLF